MTPETPLADGQKLMPHQRALIEAFLGESASQGYIARWDVGLGKSWTTPHVVKRFLELKPGGRILVLSPARALALHSHHRLNSLGVRAELVDRFRYREMQDAISDGAVMWPEGGVFVLGIDFAKQQDVAASLCLVPWTLLIADEAHALKGQREGVIRGVVDSSPGIRVLLLGVPGVGDTPALGIGGWANSTVRRSDIVDAAGHRLMAAPVVRSTQPQANGAELQLLATIDELGRLLRETDATSGEIRARIVENSMCSSLAALEAAVRGIRNSLGHGGADALQSHDGEEELTGSGEPADRDATPPLSPETTARLLEAVDRCLAGIDSIETDTKLAALVQILQAKNNPKPSRSICVLTNYRSTQAYLQTALMEGEFEVRLLHGGLALDLRSSVIEDFREHGGLLLATTALVAQGTSMPYVDSLVLFDLPRSPLEKQLILGRFWRFGRAAPLTIEVIRGVALEPPAGDSFGFGEF